MKSNFLLSVLFVFLIVAVVMVFLFRREAVAFQRDSSTLVVVPGFGITNICQIGMTFSEIKQKSPDAGIWSPFNLLNSKTWSQPKKLTVPSLGMHSYLWTNQATPVYRMSFSVAPYLATNLPSIGKNINSSFRGSIRNRLFFNGGPVHRRDVENALGEVNGELSEINKIRESLMLGKSVSNRQNDEHVTIIYPDGIEFILVSNIVISFDVYRGWGK